VIKKLKFVSGIRAKTTIYIISSVIITFIIAGSVMFVSMLNAQRESAAAEFYGIAGRHVASFEREINNALDYLASVTSFLEFQIAEGRFDREALHRAMYYMFDGHTIDSSSIYFEPDMYDGKDDEYVGTVYGTNLSGRIAYYFFRYGGRTGYRQEALADDLGFASPIYLATKESQAPTYTSPVIYNIGGVDTLMFSIGYPIFGQEHEFLGVVTANIFLDELHEQIQEEEIYETGYVIIVNDKGYMVYSPRFEDIGRARADLGFTYPLPPDDMPFEVFNARSILNNKRTLVAGQILFFPQIDGRFYVSVAAPLSEINADGTRLLLIVITLSISLIILMTIFLYYLIGRLTKPLVEFTKSTHEIAKGNYSVRITGDYQDEFAVLKDSMNRMTGRIEHSIGILQNILNGIGAFVYVADPITGELMFINDKMKEDLGLDDDVLGQLCFEVLHGSTTGMCEHCPRRRFNKDQNTAVLWESYDSITDRYYHNTSVFIDWIDNEKSHLQHSVDITDLKRVTEEKIKAEEMSQTKSAFLANMSHEIRTPMNSIIGFSELALDDVISTKTENYLINIRENSKWLLNIVNDILDISKIEAGKLELENIPFNMHELFTACRAMIAPKADEKGILLHFYAEPSIGRVPLGDPTRLRQILTNILSNAVKFTSSGIVKIQSKIINSTENTVTMSFEIKDSGIGMTEDEINRIFELFTQAQSGTTRKYGGTGLGLAITKYLVEMMGGELEVESTPGVGSKFSFKLTFDTISVDESEKTETKIVFNELRKPTFSGEVLLCEDNAMNQQVICEHLERVGINTVVAENGKIGVETVEKRLQSNEKQFDLVFMDVHMPVMDGLEAAELIHELDPNLPIVALTANIMSHDRELYKKSKMTGYMGKPFTSQELWRCLMNYFTPLHWNAEDEARNEKNEKKLKQKLINHFIVANKDIITEIEAALNEKDYTLAHRLAHTLKSNAGQLKKEALQNAAEAVENVFISGSNNVEPELLKTLERELFTVLAELEPMAHEEATTEEAEYYSNEEAYEFLMKIKPMIDDDDPECLEHIDELKLVQGSEELVRLLEDFEFIPAAELLDELLKTYTDQS